MKMRTIVVGLASLAMLPSVLWAQAPDPRARDAADFFSAFCIATEGSRDQAMSVIGDGNALAKRLPDAAVTKMQGGRSGGVGWTVHSPGGAELVLDYTGDGLCGLRIREADETAVRVAFEAAMQAAAASAGATITITDPDVKAVQGTRTTYRTYSFPLDGRTAHFALTTAERPIAPQQHFMTFAFTK